MRFFSRLLGGEQEQPVSAIPDTRSADRDGSEAADRGPASGSDSGSPPAAPPSDFPFTPPEGWDINAFTAPSAEPAAAEPLVADPHVTAELRDAVVDALKTVFDPEIPVDIYELGLIYDIQADASRRVHVRMTLTSPACPSAQQLPSEVQYKVRAVEGVSDATVEVVWEPPWDKDRMSEMARLTLGMF
jgi:FeS assembly SUF system protein